MAIQPTSITKFKSMIKAMILELLPKPKLPTDPNSVFGVNDNKTETWLNIIQDKSDLASGDTAVLGNGFGQSIIDEIAMVNEGKSGHYPDIPPSFVINAWVALPNNVQVTRKSKRTIDTLDGRVRTITKDTLLPSYMNQKPYIHIADQHENLVADCYDSVTPSEYWTSTPADIISPIINASSPPNKLVRSGDAGGRSVFRVDGLFTSGQQYTLSLWVLNPINKNIKLFVTGPPNASIHSDTYSSVQNKWTRLQITFTLTETSTALYVGPIWENNNYQQPGDIFWATGLQINKGNVVAPLVLTSGIPSICAGDILTIPQDGWFNDEGTVIIYMNSGIPNYEDRIRRIFHFGPDQNEYVSLYFDSDDRLRLDYKVQEYKETISFEIDENKDFKIAVAYTRDTIKVCLSGHPCVTRALTSALTTPGDNLKLGCSMEDDEFLNGKIYELIYYPQSLSVDQISTLVECCTD